MSLRKRRWLLVLSSGIILLGVIAASFPFWFPYLLRPVARHFGIEYRDWNRVGKDMFALTDLHGKQGGISFGATRLEGFLPWKWKDQLRRNETNETPPVFLLVNGWNMQLTSTNSGSSRITPYEAVQLVRKQAAKLNDWIPHAVFLNGTFRWKDQEMSSSTIILQRGKIAGDITLPQTAATADFKVDLSNRATNTFSIRIDAWDVSTRIRAINQPGSTALTLTGSWKTNRLSGSAELKPGDLLPAEAHLNSEGIQLPAELVKADGFESFFVQFNADWKTNGFKIETSVHAQPEENSKKKRPEFDLSLAAAGDRRQATLLSARIFAPWIDAHLDKSVGFDYQGNLETFNVPFRINADMDKQTWLPLRGKLDGTLLLNARTIKEPNLNFALNGHEITGFGLNQAGLKFAGKLRWPELIIQEGSFSQTNGTHGTFTGKINLETREVSTTRFNFVGKLGEPLLRGKLNYQSAAVSAEVTGFWLKLHHAGSLTITNLSYGAFKNADIMANWAGTYPDLDSVSVGLKVGTNRVNLTGALRVHTGETNLTIQTLDWTAGDRLIFGATTSFDLSLRAATNSIKAIASVPEIVVRGLKLRGQNTVISADAALAWPSRGQIQVSVTNLNSLLFAPLLATKIPEISVPKFNLAAEWNEGPLQIDLNMLYNAVVGNVGLVTSSINLQGDERGLTVTGLNVSGPSGAIIRAEGTLPVTIFPQSVSGQRLKISGTREVNFQAVSAPNESFWDAIGKWSGIYIQNPILKVEVSGKTKEPTGSLAFTASEIHTTRYKRALPRIENIRLRAKLDARKFNLETLDFSADQQFLHTSANVSLPENLWREPRSQILDYLTTNATVIIRGSDLQITPFAKYAPKMLAPQGTASLDLKIAPPLALSGEILIKDAATRPLESVGPVQSITARVRLDDRKIQIKEFSGELAGQNLSVTGTVDWTESMLATGFPGLDLHISGKSIPLARRPDLILRGDVDLAIAHTAKIAPTISGNVNLRNSFFLSDLKFLVPGRLAKPRNRPPYFSIEQEPFSNWLLNIHVTGDRFMKVRSPFFQGEVSSDFKISGTLREPLALGDATINSGFVQFPFANLEVKQGLVTLALDDPYLPKVLLTAGARAFGYELKMQVTGPVDVPVIDFSSTPPLTSEEIVLMLTAGQLPNREQIFSNQQKAGTLALFLGKSLWAKFGADEPGAERLTVRSGEDISDQGRQTYSVEYRLSKNWSLVGEYDRFSAVNAGFKWRLYSR